jgi:adenosylcobinamide-GDP ribazoletransferase
MLLTRLPAGQLQAPVPSLGQSAWAFPLAGLAVGGLSALTLLAAHALNLPLGIAAGLALLVGVLATGGLHEDGLADLADGFGGGRTRERKLEIMRDSRIGSYGTLALILSLGLRWQALESLPLPMAAMAVLAVAMASRAVLPAIMVMLPAARSDGLGKSASGGGAPGASVGTLIGLAALLLCLGPSAAFVVSLAMALMALAMARLALRQIGGQTGDVLGAIQQCTELAALISLTAIAAP